MKRMKCALIIKDDKVLCLKEGLNLMLPSKKVNLFNHDEEGKSFIKSMKRKYSMDISLLSKIFSLKDEENNIIYDLYIYQYERGSISYNMMFLTLEELKKINFSSNSFIHNFIIDLLSKNHYVITIDKKEYSSSYNKNFLIDMFDDVSIIFDEDISYLEFLLKKDLYKDNNLSLKYFKNGMLDKSFLSLSY